MSGRLRLSASGTTDSLRVAGCSNFQRGEEEKLGKLTFFDSVSSSEICKALLKGKLNIGKELRNSNEPAGLGSAR